jgi:hypothetical protein
VNISAAAENNARRCDAVCRSHGLATRFADGLWIAPDGSPPFYPDVTGAGVGVSNVFGESVWPDVAAVIAAAFPGRPIAGCERGGELARLALIAWHR